MADLAARVEQKLASSVLRRLEGIRAIDRHRHKTLFTWYSRFRDVALALGAAGVTHPVLSLVTGEPGDTTVAAWMGTVPFWVAAAATCLLIPWTALRIYVHSERLAEVVPLYNACKRELGELEGRLDDALATEDPLAAISPLVDEASAIVRRYYLAGNWPWQVGPDGVDADVRSRARTMVERHRGAWRTVKDIDGRAEAA